MLHAPPPQGRSRSDTYPVNMYVGSRITASQNLALRADRDITLTAAVGRGTEQTKRSSSAASVGISFGVGGLQSGVALTLAASRSNAWSNGWGTTFWNSELTTGKLLSVDAGRDTSLSGAKATGETVLARVGSKGAGSLSIVSPQDESFYQAKEQSFGFNVSIPWPGNGYGAPSLGVNAGGLKLLAENESVKQQSSIVAGTGGYDVRVSGHTHLKGSAIASKADAWRNYFETQTLTHEDVANRDVASGKGWSVGVNISAGSSGAGALAGSSVSFARMDTNETFTTKSSIAGTVTMTRPDLQAGRAAAMKAAERDPLVAVRDQKQYQLNELRWNEPPPCDRCAYNGGPPTAPLAAIASGKGATSGMCSPAANGCSAAISRFTAQPVCRYRHLCCQPRVVSLSPSQLMLRSAEVAAMLKRCLPILSRSVCASQQTSIRQRHQSLGRCASPRSSPG